MSSKLKVNNIIPSTGTQIGISTTGGGINLLTGTVVTGIVTASGFDGPITQSGDFTIDDYIVHAGDTDTKLGFPSADAVDIFAGGKQVRLTSDGHLGINRTTPAAPITARRTDAGGTGTSGVIAEFANSSGYGVWFGQSSASGAAWGATTGDFYWNTGGLSSQVERLRFTSTGQFHMGGGNGWTYASQKFVVVEPSNALGMLLQGNNANQGVNLTLQNINNTVNAYSDLSFADDGGQIFGAIRGKVVDRDNNHGEIQFHTSAGSLGQKVTIDKDGKVSVGTVQTTHTLGVTGGSSSQLLVKGTEADIWLNSTGPNGVWRILGSTGGNTHRFRIYDNTNGKEPFYIDGSSGSNTQHVHVNSGNLVFDSHGTGIDFSANTDDESGAGSISANGEILDDYEEGSWTPTIYRSNAGYSGNYNHQQGVYTKIGRLVHLAFNVDINNFSGGSGHVAMGGLPFSIGGNGLSGWPHAANMSRLYLDGDYAAGVDARSIRFTGSNYGYVMNQDDDQWDYGNYTRVIFEGSFTFMV